MCYFRITTNPAIGFNVETLHYKNLKFNVWVRTTSPGAAVYSTCFPRYTNHRTLEGRHLYALTGDATMLIRRR